MRRALRWGAGSRRTDAERGAAAVEFALVVPVLLMLVFGIVNFGQFLSVRQAATQAAAEGARAAAVTPTGGDPAANGEAAIDAALDGIGGCGDGVACNVVIATCGDAQCATATVAIDFEPLIGAFPDIVFPDTISYSATAEVN
jgi:Flp pilus assembly protein TadG